MRTLANGLAVSADDDRVAADIDALEAELLRYGKGVADYLGSDAATGDTALGPALAAAVHLFAMTAESRERAAPLIRAAVHRASAATARERLVVDAIGAWSVGDTRRAIEVHMEVARRWPTDLLSARICQFHQLNMGDFEGMRGCTELLARAQPKNGFVLGMHAFALEQAGEVAAAERLGRRAATMNVDPWAHHAVAHALDTTGRAAEGREWMRANATAWDDCSSFLYTHNWWHAALFEIDLGDHEAALRLFDGRVWGVRRDSCQDQVNAVSLLVRFELLGLDVGARWEDLAPHLERRIGDRANPFLDLHYAYGLARAGRDVAVERQLRGLSGMASGGDPRERERRGAAALAARGMAAHARGDHATAALLLRTAGPAIQSFGGSRTQRRLFDLVREDSVGRLGPAGRALAVARR